MFSCVFVCFHSLSSSSRLFPFRVCLCACAPPRSYPVARSVCWGKGKDCVFYGTMDEAHRPYKVHKHTLGTLITLLTRHPPHVFVSVSLFCLVVVFCLLAILLLCLVLLGRVGDAPAGSSTSVCSDMAFITQREIDRLVISYFVPLSLLATLPSFFPPLSPPLAQARIANRTSVSSRSLMSCTGWGSGAP